MTHSEYLVGAKQGMSVASKATRIKPMDCNKKIPPWQPDFRLNRGGMYVRERYARAAAKR